MICIREYIQARFDGEGVDYDTAEASKWSLHSKAIFFFLPISERENSLGHLSMILLCSWGKIPREKILRKFFFFERQLFFFKISGYFSNMVIERVTVQHMSTEEATDKRSYHE